MNIQEQVRKMNEIQTLLLEYIDDDDDNQEKFQNLTKLFINLKIQETHQFSIIIYFLAMVVNYHHRKIHFFDKIFRIILFFKDDLKKNFTNYEIFDFFKNNKRVLLFLSDEKIISFDEKIAQQLCFKKSIKKIGLFLLPEIKPFIKKELIASTIIPENIEEYRKTEYCDNTILQLVQKDSINEFIKYINTNDFNINQDFVPSIFETNNILANKPRIKLIEYSAFFGSIRIFKYLLACGSKLNPNLWIFATFGRNANIIHILEDNKIVPTDQIYKRCLDFSIRCHHNELVDYFLNNYVEIEDKSSFLFKKGLKYYNFEFIQPELINSDTLYDLCKRDYFFLAKTILESDKSIDINSRILRERRGYDSQIRKEKTLLYRSIEKGNFDIIKFLFEYKNIDVNKKSFITDCEDVKSELTPLYAAINLGNIEIIQFLFGQTELDINMISKVGKEQQTPLVTAIYKNNIDIVRLLLQRSEIDVNLRSIDYEKDIDECTTEEFKDVTPLYYAVDHDCYEIAKLLLENPNIDVNAKAFITIEQFYTTTGEKYKPEYSEKTAIYNAVYNRKTEFVKLLLSQEKIDVSINGKETSDQNIVQEITLMQAAVVFNNTEIVKLLLEMKNIDVNSKLIEAELKGDKDLWDEEEIKSRKLKIRNDFNNKISSSLIPLEIAERTPLYIAIVNDNVEIVQLLLGYEETDANIKSFYKSYGYSLNSEGKEKETKRFSEMTPLYFAIENGNDQIVQLLVENEKVDVNMKCSSYFWEYKGIYMEGKQQGDNSKIEEIDKEETALHNAVAKEDLSAIKCLLNNKNIDVNIIDKQGRKPIELTNKNEIKSIFK